MSVGLAKACGLRKEIYSVIEKSSALLYIILVLGYCNYGIPLGSSVFRICYLTTRESIGTPIRSY